MRLILKQFRYFTDKQYMNAYFYSVVAGTVEPVSQIAKEVIERQ